MPREIQRVLSSELEKRLARNRHYSLRAFSRDLKIGFNALTEAMRGKRRMSPGDLQRLFEALPIDERTKHKIATQELHDESEGTKSLSTEEFSKIFHWYYFGILSLADLKGNQADPTWVSKRLGLKLGRTAQAMERLTEMGFLEIRDGRMFRTEKPLTTTNEIPAEALKHVHRESLDNAKLSLEKVPADQREVNSTTFAMAPARLPEAKKLIQEFKKKMCALLEEGERTEVYTLCVSLFPTKGDAV